MFDDTFIEVSGYLVTKPASYKNSSGLKYCNFVVKSKISNQDMYFSCFMWAGVLTNRLLGFNLDLGSRIRVRGSFVYKSKTKIPLNIYVKDVAAVDTYKPNDDFGNIKKQVVSNVSINMHDTEKESKEVTNVNDNKVVEMFADDDPFS